MSVSTPELGRVCLRQLRRAASQTRSFSSTTRRRKNGPIASFPQTSSPELDKILNTLRQNVFLPAHLRTPQKHLIYRKHFQHYLTGEEPVKVELETLSPGKSSSGPDSKEEFTLQPLNKQRDEPNFLQTYHTILELLRGKPEDWAVVPGLLREFVIAGYSIKEKQIEKLVRRAALEHKIGLMVECFRQKDLGLKLSSTAIAHHFMLGAHQTALDVEFEQKELDKAIKYATFVLRTIQDRRHIPVDAKDDPKTHPEIFGAALALTAMRRWLWETKNTEEQRAARAAAVPEVESPAGEEAAAESAEGETPAAEATRGSERQVAEASSDVYALGAFDLADIEKNARQVLANSENAQLDFDASSHSQSDVMLQRWLPTWFGIQIASRITQLDPEVRERLQAAFEGDINPTVQQALGAVRKIAQTGAAREPRGVRIYEQYKAFLT